MLPRFSFRRPTNLRSALETLHTHPARIHAGGTDLLGCLRDRVFDADAVVSLGAIDELKGIRKGLGGDMVIGAMTTIDSIARDPDVITRFAALAQAAAAVASPQLRAQGTLGGNLCQKTRCWYYRGRFPCLRKGGDHCFAYEGRNEHHCIFGGEGCYMVHPSDTAPALAALGAICRISGPTTSRSVPVEQFHIPAPVDPQRETVLAADEILTEIHLPAPPPNLRSSYRKVRTRKAWDFALAGVALALDFDDNIVRSARIFLAGAAPVPWRTRAAEEAVTGRHLDAETIERASRAAVEDAEPLEHNHAKITLFEAIVAEQLKAIGSADFSPHFIGN
jgi:xanthine dehydrogenase YagS FAD-binding subunit